MTQHIKELLELAAKACGYVVEDCGDVGAWVCLPDKAPINGSGPVFLWAPHLDDGDGARMETQLDLDIQRHKDRVVVCSQDIWRTVEFYADHNGNRQAARRMASLRVAAEVGRRMK